MAGCGFRAGAKHVERGGRDVLAEPAALGAPIQLDGDTASGRAYISELIRFRGGKSELNYGIYHDRYR